MTKDKDKEAPPWHPGFDAGTPDRVPMLPLPVQSFECPRCKGDGLRRNGYGEPVRNAAQRCDLCGGSGLVSAAISLQEATK